MHRFVAGRNANTRVRLYPVASATWNDFVFSRSSSVGTRYVIHVGEMYRRRRGAAAFESSSEPPSPLVAATKSFRSKVFRHAPNNSTTSAFTARFYASSSLVPRSLHTRGSKQLPLLLPVTRIVSHGFPYTGRWEYYNCSRQS